MYLSSGASNNQTRMAWVGWGNNAATRSTHPDFLCNTVVLIAVQNWTLGVDDEVLHAVLSLVGMVVAAVSEVISILSLTVSPAMNVLVTPVSPITPVPFLPTVSITSTLQ